MRKRRDERENRLRLTGVRCAGHLRYRVNGRPDGVNDVVPLRGLTAAGGSRQGEWAMTTALTRIPAQPPMRLAGVSAFILFVVILILPH